MLLYTLLLYVIHEYNADEPELACDVINTHPSAANGTLAGSQDFQLC